LIFEIELLKILTEEEYNEYMAALEAKEQAAFEAQIETQFIQDKKLIQNYVLDKRLRTKRTRSGLSYAITKKGKGATAKKGDELSVSYKGYLLDGKPFDASKAKETYKVLLGLGKVIKGWDEGLTFFTEGSEGILLIPSKLAYGPRGIYEKNVAIPPNSVLVFDIKVEKIKRKEVN
jgi:peptidyl-prolyl cis-trans isomerase A (cyclophilin A)